MSELSESDKQLKGREYLRDAQNHMRKSEYREAIECLHKSKEFYEDSDIPRYLAESHAHLGEWVKTEQVLTPLISKGTQDAHIFYLMGFAKFEQKKQEEARPYLERFLDLAKGKSYLKTEVRQVKKMLGKKLFGLF